MDGADAYESYSVSIHAPARGATCVLDVSAFLSRVSIHAPARGATAACRTVRGLPGCFNPRPRAGGDMSGLCAGRWRTCFNPRPRAGGDASSGLSASGSCCFNPRPRAGGDTSPKAPVSPPWPVSIHAPARGATIAKHMVRSWQMFQSTPPRGGRRAASIGRTRLIMRFNPRPRAGGD